MGELSKLLKLSKRNLIPLPKIGKDILGTLLLKSDREFIELITNNKVISSFILSVANHPKYRKNNPPVQDIRLALLILGEDLVKILVLSFISTNLCKVTFNEFNFHYFWTRAIANLCFSFICAPYFKTFSPYLYISSYLMDFGIIILYSLFPEGYLKVLKLKKLGLSTCQAEKEVFGVDHAVIGSRYFETYNLPRRFILNIQHHHQFSNLPEDIPPQVFEDIKILNFIDLGVGCYFSTNKEIKFKDFKTLAKLYFNLEDSQAESILDALPNYTNSLYEVLNYKNFSLIPYSQSIKACEEKLKETFKNLEEQKKKEEPLLELYRNELIKATREKETLIEEIEVLKKKLKDSSILDPLTGLYNEDYFLKRLEEELLRAKRYRRNLSVLLMEIDKFSKLIEFYGLEEEGRLLNFLAQALRRKLRRVDILAKLSKPEQFAIILPETFLSGAMVVARKILRITDEVFYKRYNKGSSSYIVIVSYDPLKLNPKVEPKIEGILNTLNKGLEFLKLRGQKRILPFLIDKELEPQ